MNYRMLIILAVLIALPFSPKAQFVPDSALIDTSDMAGWLTLPDSIKVDGGWLVAHGPDTVHFHNSRDSVVVYYIDTVGWTIHEHRGPVFTTTGWDEGPTTRIIDSLVPIIDTIIVGYFYADTKQRIKDWRVR